jgi:hypothetical protein
MMLRDHVLQHSRFTFEVFDSLHNQLDVRQSAFDYFPA